MIKIDHLLEQRLQPNWEELARVWPCFENRGTNSTMLSSLSEYLKSPILYIGGGRGKYPASLKEKGFDITVVDASSAMCRAASEEFGLHYIHGSILELDLPVFPTIISVTGVLDTMSDKNRKKALDKIARACTGSFISFFSYPSQRLKELSKYVPCLENDFFNNKLILEYWHQGVSLPSEEAQATLQRFYVLYDAISCFLQTNKEWGYQFLKKNLPDLDHLPNSGEVVKELFQHDFDKVSFTLFEEGNTAMYLARRKK